MGELGSEEVLFRQVQPSLNLWDHPNRIGITLKSAQSTRKRGSSPGMAGRKLSARSSLSTRAKSSTVRFTPQLNDVQYIQNIVVPINAPDDDVNVKQSATPRSFSGARARTGFPQMRGRATEDGTGTAAVGDRLGDRSGAKTSMSTPLCPTERQYAWGSLRASAKAGPRTPHELIANQLQSAASLLHVLWGPSAVQSLPADAMSVHSSEYSRWNKSEQALRYEHEQESLDRSRDLKRVSAVRPHRVDRMYYMSGTSFNMRNRYHVEDEELQRLKDLAKARNASKSYGKGTSKTLHPSFPHPPLESRLTSPCACKRRYRRNGRTFLSPGLFQIPQPRNVGQIIQSAKDLSMDPSRDSSIGEPVNDKIEKNKYETVSLPPSPGIPLHAPSPIDWSPGHPSPSPVGWSTSPYLALSPSPLFHQQHMMTLCERRYIHINVETCKQTDYVDGSNIESLRPAIQV